MIKVLFLSLVFQISVYFSPAGGTQKAIIDEINAAQNTKIEVLSYSFTSKPLADALIAAKSRNCQVIVVLDRKESLQASSQRRNLVNAGIKVYTDSKHLIMHDKVILIPENQVLITGSYNFTNNAEQNNAENCLIIKQEPELLQKYQQNFDIHKNHAIPVN